MRLCYLAYLLHPIVMYAFYMNMQQTIMVNYWIYVSFLHSVLSRVSMWVMVRITTGPFTSRVSFLWLCGEWHLDFHLFSSYWLSSHWADCKGFLWRNESIILLFYQDNLVQILCVIHGVFAWVDHGLHSSCHKFWGKYFYIFRRHSISKLQCHFKIK